MLVALAAVWGASFLFIRVSVDDLGPVAVADWRLLGAAATLALLLIPTGRLVRPRAPWRKYFLLGAVNAAAPFTLIALAEKRLDASLAAIINASTPLFSALVGAAVGRGGADPPPRARAVVGLGGGVPVLG